MFGFPTFDPGFSTPRLEEIFSAERRVRAMLEVEAALANAQAELGLVPRVAAAAIARAISLVEVDAEVILRQGWRVGTVVVPLLDRVRAGLDPEAARWLHFGATTQDVVDSALMLQVREAIEELAKILRSIAARCRTVAAQHRSTPALARTFLQPALPTTFGARVARWFAAIDASSSALEVERAKLPVQLGGPIGDLAVRLDRGAELNAAVARALGLAAAPISWHTDRSPIHDVIWALHRAVRACTKCALDVMLLAQAELGEVDVRAGSSSSMAHKQNPADAMRTLAAAEAFMGVASVVLRAQPPSLERGPGVWHAEQFAVPLAFHTAAAVMASTDESLEELTPNAARMIENLGEHGAPIERAGELVDLILGDEK